MQCRHRAATDCRPLLRWSRWRRLRSRRPQASFRWCRTGLPCPQCCPSRRCYSWRKCEAPRHAQVLGYRRSLPSARQRAPVQTAVSSPNRGASRGGDALPARFDRYILTAGYNGIINRRQFNIKDLEWPTEYRYPDRTYSDHLNLEVGGMRAELHHAKGETDDHTWTWFPDRKVLCCGDLFIWASPNAGNPQKVQRYPREWAEALREMLALYDGPNGGPDVLLPGHGFPVMGADRIRQALGDTGDLLDSLVDQTLALMNQGARLDEIIHAVTPPPRLMERPYLQPVYDEPEFIVRTVWRQYGGWWDGNPATLQPAPERDLAGELAGLAGGASALADRALALLESSTGAEGNGPDDAALRLAGHLAELAWQVEPADPGIQRIRQRVFEARAEAATSTMARGEF